MYKNKLGSIGEFWIAYELSLLGIDVVVIGGNNRFNIADIIINGNKTVEVKTSVYSNNRKSDTKGEHVAKSGWGFGGLLKVKGNKPDYFAFVLLNEDLSIYKTIYVKSESINSGSFWYLKPNEETKHGARGPLPSETTWKDYFMTAEQFANLIISTSEI